MSATSTQTLEQSVIFIHSCLDDYGLSPSEFRVYAHVARRGGATGAAWSSVPNIARLCRLHPQTVRKALRTLTAQRLLSAEFRAGESTCYRLTSSSTWLPPKTAVDNPAETGAPPSDSTATPAKRIHRYPSEMSIDKGNPIEGDPKKEIPVPPLSPKGERVTSNNLLLSQAETIYAAYPKQVAKPAALRAIRRALTNHPFETLLERTLLYAKTYNGAPRFIPDPANWFRDERFNDDPATWRRAPGAGNRPAPAIIRADRFQTGVTHT